MHIRGKVARGGWTHGSEKQESGSKWRAHVPRVPALFPCMLKKLTVYLLWLYDVLQHHVFQISFLNLFRFKHMKFFVVF